MGTPVTPVNVWAYWESGGKALPDLVNMCIASWHKHLDPAQFTIRLLDRGDLEAYDIAAPRGFDDLFPAVRSDIVRATLLAKHGGLWMDASTYLPGPLSWLHCWPNPDEAIDCNEGEQAVSGEAVGGEAVSGEAGCTLFAFQEPWRPYPENCFLHVPSGRPSRLMQIWRDTLVDIVTTVPVESHPSHGANTVFPTNNYYFMYDAWMWLRKNNAEFAQLVRRGRYSMRSVQWNPVLPLDSHKYIVKYTSLTRQLYPFFKFPLCYVWLALCIAAGIAVAAAIRRRRRERVL